MLNRISVDGFYAATDGGIDWFIADPDVDAAAHDIIQADTVLFGRTTYLEMASFWPHVHRNPEAPVELRRLADEMDQMTKVVFSRTLTEVTWQNAILAGRDPASEVRKRKQGNGPDITIFGSGTVVQQLARESLIDDYILVVTPVALGAGKPLFHDIPRQGLQLMATRHFVSGNVLLHYRPGR
jgi:dihydrofolate reductase